MSKELTAHTGLKSVNFDDVYEFLKSRGESDPTSLEKAKNISDKRMSLYLNGRLGMVIDRTSWNYDEVLKLKKLLEDLGYDCMMVYVNTDIDVAKTRVQQRFQKNGRRVDNEYIDMVFKQLNKNLGKYQQDFSRNLIIVDNSTNTDGTKVEWASKQVDKFLNTSPKSQVATDWIRSQV